jgi:hypothetical protein
MKNPKLETKNMDFDTSNHMQWRKHATHTQTRICTARNKEPLKNSNKLLNGKNKDRKKQSEEVRKIKRAT